MYNFFWLQNKIIAQELDRILIVNQHCITDIIRDSNYHRLPV